MEIDYGTNESGNITSGGGSGITNPALEQFGSGDGGEALGSLMARLFQTAIFVGALALLLYIVWGGLSWITAGGDTKKIEEARNRILNGIIGMVILVGTIAIVYFVSEVLGLDLLNPTIPEI